MTRFDWPLLKPAAASCLPMNSFRAAKDSCNHDVTKTAVASDPRDA
jgi:hypothetical protein